MYEIKYNVKGQIKSKQVEQIDINNNNNQDDKPLESTSKSSCSDSLPPKIEPPIQPTIQTTGNEYLSAECQIVTFSSPVPEYGIFGYGYGSFHGQSFNARQLRYTPFIQKVNPIHLLPMPIPIPMHHICCCEEPQPDYHQQSNQINANYMPIMPFNSDPSISYSADCISENMNGNRMMNLSTVHNNVNVNNRVNTYVNSNTIPQHDAIAIPPNQFN